MLTRARLRRRRRQLARSTDHPALQRFFKAPLLAADCPWREGRFVALDMETTGLDPTTAEMLSIGWVPIEGGAIELRGAQTHLIRPTGGVGQSATIHGLTDTQLRKGSNIEEALAALLKAIESSIVIVHHAMLDIGMLDRATRNVFGLAVPFPVIDTLALQKNKLMRERGAVAGNALRLQAVRDAYNLPAYSAHECLGDAIATAEVFLAMVQHRFGDRGTRIKDLWG